MRTGPAAGDPGRDEDPAAGGSAEPSGPWWEDTAPGWLDAHDDDGPGEQDEEDDDPEPGDSPWPGGAAGPAGAAGLFAAGRLLDEAGGGAALLGFADTAAGPGDTYAGVSDDELIGIVGAWDRVEAHACARKHAAVAELIRRRPAEGLAPAGPGRMPECWDEFTESELAAALAESRAAAGAMLDLAADLQVRLPGTWAAFREGVLRRSKVAIIAAAAALLDPAEARAAEALVLGRAGRLTPGGLRSAIARAVMQVAPDKAGKRREAAARDARVERWPEDSGNAALAGRELPPAAVLAADQRVSWWAGQLRAAGLDGDMDQLRARAYLDLLLGVDSRPARDDTSARPDGPPGARTDGGRIGTADGPDSDAGGPAGGPGTAPDSDAGGPAGGPGTAPGGDAGGAGGPAGGPGPHGPAGGPPAAGPLAGAVPAGFAGRVNLTVTLPTVLGLADRPGELAGIGPVDPGLARNLAAAAARNPRTTWCVTVTDAHGHAIGHGCARPEAAGQRKGQAEPRTPGPPGGHDPPRGAGGAGPPGFAFTASARDGPPGGYGTWRLSTGAGSTALIVALHPIATSPCDHRFEAAGHDPGVMLRHLTEIRHATCTSPVCRRPASRSEFEHNTPYESGGRTCLCNGNPKCRHDHRLKQHPRWNVEQLPTGAVQWTTPSGRKYVTEPTRYPI